MCAAIYALAASQAEIGRSKLAAGRKAVAITARCAARSGQAVSFALTSAPNLVFVLKRFATVCDLQVKAKLLLNNC